jgi:hypothetical protein
MILTRTCQGRTLKTDLPTIGTSLKQIPSECATREAKDLADLRGLGRTIRMDWARPGRTVCEIAADCPKIAFEPPVAHPEKRTVRALVRTVRDGGTVHTLLANHPQNSLQTNTTDSTDRNTSSQEHDEHLVSWILADCPPCTDRTG